MKDFWLRLVTREGCPLSPCPLNITLEILVSAISQEKEIKGIEIGKEEIKLSLLIDDMNVYVENPKESTKHLLELINEFCNITEYKVKTNIKSHFYN